MNRFVGEGQVMDPFPGSLPNHGPTGVWLHLDRFVTAERAKADFGAKFLLRRICQLVGSFLRLTGSPSLGSYGLMPLSKGGYRTDSGKVFEV